MPLEINEAAKVASEMLANAEGDWTRLKSIKSYIEGNESKIHVPTGARREYRALVNMANINMMRPVVEAISQRLAVDGYRSATNADDTIPWDIWQANGMDAHQSMVHKDALAYGWSFVVVLPGQPFPKIKPVSARNMTAFYMDKTDEFPLYAIEKLYVPGAGHLVKLYDEVSIKVFSVSQDDTLTFKSEAVHNLGFVPVVRFTNTYDATGRFIGEVEPLFTLQDQLNQTTYHLLMSQEFGAFIQKYVTGWEVPTDDNGNPIPGYELRADVSRLLAFGDDDVKVGSFPQTTLDGVLKSRESIVQAIATASQVPPHYLLGQLTNLSAEALAASESGQSRRVGDRQVQFGEAWERVLRIASYMNGNEDAFDDVSSQVLWKDTESRSMGQQVDALVKLVQGLQVPIEAAWLMIPGVTQVDVESWKIQAASGDTQRFLDALAQTQDPVEVQQLEISSAE